MKFWESLKKSKSLTKKVKNIVATLALLSVFWCQKDANNVPIEPVTYINWIPIEKIERMSSFTSEYTINIQKARESIYNNFWDTDPILTIVVKNLDEQWFYTNEENDTHRINLIVSDVSISNFDSTPNNWNPDLDTSFIRPFWVDENYNQRITGEIVCNQLSSKIPDHFRWFNFILSNSELNNINYQIDCEEDFFWEEVSSLSIHIQ